MVYFSINALLLEIAEDSHGMILVRVGRPSEKHLVSASRTSFRQLLDRYAPLKICKKCKAEKPATEFHNRASAKDGLSHDCKVCARAANHEWRKSNPEKFAASKKAWAAKNAEAEKERKRKWYIANKEFSAERGRLWRKENPEKTEASRLKWANANPLSARARVKKWASANPDAIAANSRKRRSMKRGAVGTHTAKDVSHIFESQRGKCTGCQSNLKKSGNDKFHVDHIMPLSRGGSNDKYNLQLLCPLCNMRKHAKHPIDWAQENGKLL